MKRKENIRFMLGVYVCIFILAFTAGSAAADKDNQKQKKQTETTASSSESSTSKKYTGERGNFIFHDADLKNVLLFFARVYKLNVIIDPGVSGKVTCRLINVPWDQALDLILRQNGMMMLKEGKGKALSFQKIKK